MQHTASINTRCRSAGQLNSKCGKFYDSASKEQATNETGGAVNIAIPIIHEIS
jgi:hypothetical protein